MMKGLLHQMCLEGKVLKIKTGVLSGLTYDFLIEIEEDKEK